MKAHKIAFTFQFIPLISCITPGTIIIKIATSLQKVRKIWRRALQLTLILFRTITTAAEKEKEKLKGSISHPSKSIMKASVRQNLSHHASQALVEQLTLPLLTFNEQSSYSLFFKKIKYHQLIISSIFQSINHRVLLAFQ